MKKSLLSVSLIIAFCSLFFNPLTGQEMISLEDIWFSSKLQPKRVPGFNFLKDGRHYSRLEDNQIRIYDIVTGTLSEVLFDVEDSDKFSSIDRFQFSPDENYILLAVNSEKIYRHSSLAHWYIYDRSDRSLRALWKQKARDPLFSPDGSKIGFSSSNNLVVYDIKNHTAIPITDDGAWNHIINGTADWVYEEEFGITRLFDWSADGRYLAWLKLDESEVPKYIMPVYRDEVYPIYESFKYPKVGEANSKLSLYCYDTKTKESTHLTVDQEFEYLPRLYFSKNNDVLVFMTLNRHQNHLVLNAMNISTGDKTILLEESSDQYIDVHDNLTFLKDGKRFIWTSDRSGFNHIYLGDFDGNIEPLTKGTYEVTSLYGVDEKAEKIYFQAAKNSPLEREVYETALNTYTPPRPRRDQKGFNSAQFSSSFDYYVSQHSSAGSPPVYAVYDKNDQHVRTLEDNADLRNQMGQISYAPKEFFEIENSNGDLLNAYMIRPVDFNADSTYPVFMFLYGGPGSQQVMNAWDSRYFWWFQHLAQKGYIVACVDNRGTGGRGAAFKKQTYLRLGELETMDQIDAARHLGALPYIDASRIGIFGWSYGGYMSTNCLLHGNDVFKMAVAVAPVTNWKWYDNIYTERYMRTEDENPEGYRAYSPIYFADKLKGAYLLVHGTGDDNVHFQHSIEMANALINANKDFETMFYPNRDHAIYGGKTRWHLFRLMTDFIERKL